MYKVRFVQMWVMKTLHFTYSKQYEILYHFMFAEIFQQSCELYHTDSTKKGEKSKCDTKRKAPKHDDDTGGGRIIQRWNILIAKGFLFSQKY